MFKVFNLTQFGSNNKVQLENKTIEGLQHIFFFKWATFELVPHDEGQWKISKKRWNALECRFGTHVHRSKIKKHYTDRTHSESSSDRLTKLKGIAHPK